MIQKKLKLCENLDCKTQANFKMPNEKGKRFCAEHKKEGMINYRSVLCNVNGCDVVGIYC